MNASTTTATSAAIKAAPGRLLGASLTAAGDVATLIIYDNASAGSGTVLLKLSAIANTTAQAMLPDGGIVAGAGLYAALTGTTPSATVIYG